MSSIGTRNPLTDSNSPATFTRSGKSFAEAFRPLSHPIQVGYNAAKMLLRYVRQFFGAKPMSCVGHGKPAPVFTLPGMNGESFSLAAALKKGSVLAAFFKISCPVCQFTFPFLQRMYEMYGGEKVTLWAVSQDDSGDTRDFCKEFGVKFPALIDADGYPVSNQYGITNVPSIFLIAPDGKLIASGLGFDKKILEKMSKELAHYAGKPEHPLFRPGEIVPDYKPG